MSRSIAPHSMSDAPWPIQRSGNVCQPVKLAASPAAPTNVLRQDALEQMGLSNSDLEDAQELMTFWIDDV